MSRTKIRIFSENSSIVSNLLDKFNCKYNFDGQIIYTEQLKDHDAYKLINMLITNDVEVYELSPEIATLESIYIDIISKRGEI